MKMFVALLVLLAFVHESVGETYSIADAAQFMEFASNVNSGKKYSGDTVYLTNDIDLSAYSESYTPVGLGFNAWFLGTFDGQGHTFSGLKYNSTKYDTVGLFGKIGGTTLKNFVVDDTCSFTILHEERKCYMDDAAGIVGNVLAVEGDITLTNLVNMATITGGYWSGGIAGSGSVEKGTITISNSVNYGTITGMYCYSGLAMVGGIAGFLFAAGRTTKRITISNCANYGYLINPYMLKDAEFGGIIGQIDDVILIKNNVNLGTMKAGGMYVNNTGNIIGYTSGSSIGTAVVRNNYWMKGNFVEKDIGTVDTDTGRSISITQDVNFDSDYTLSTIVTVEKYTGRSLIDALNGEDEENSKWSLVSFVLNGGKFPGHSYSTVPVFDGHFPSPVKNGATFKGWYLDSAFTEKYDPLAGHSLEKLILYAKW